MRLRDLLLLAGLGLCPTLSYALSCSINSVQSINFGTVNPLSSTSNNTSMTFGYSCTKSVLDVFSGVTLCFNIGASAVSGQVNTRSMSFSGPPVSTLNYQLYQNSGRSIVWGSQFQAGTTPVLINLTSLIPLVPVTGSLTVYAQLLTPQITAAPGSYLDSYTTATASLTTNVGPLVPPGTCGATVGATFPFTVLAVVPKQCSVTANGNINFGSVNATAVNTTSNNTISVTCTNSTPYTVGLAPSNGNTAGSGIMTSTGTDTVGYQLSSTPGPSGTAWGNTTLNNVSGSGIGSATTYTVYATVPSANHTPGNYSDTVTINVTY